MRWIPRQKIWLTLMIVTNLALWIIPSDVVEKIAREQHVLLGRYSRQHFMWILAMLVLTPVSFYVDWSTGDTYKKRWFQVLATILILGPAFLLADYLVRSPQSDHYVRDSAAYHRPPNAEFGVTFEDKPVAARSYPSNRPGYGAVQCKLHTDSRGYRNQTDADRYDVVVLGDSFAEGSSVSDEHVWPVQLARATGLSVYNLGMSGYDPYHYLESLKERGLALQPQFVVCLLYEGNDFRSAKTDAKRRNPSLSKSLKAYFGRSTILSGLEKLIIDTFGPINSRGSVSGGDVLDWMPLAVPVGGNANYYAFAPKQLRDLYESREQFSLDKHWLNPRRQIADMNRLCREVGIEFVLVFAPLKAHVVLPAAADRLEPKKVRSFLKLHYKKDLPEADTFFASLMQNITARDEVVGEWCKRESIPYLSVTRSLRTAALAGTQVYYTYDQHWTPDGHAVVSDTVAAFLRERRPGENVAAGTR